MEGLSSIIEICIMDMAAAECDSPLPKLDVPIVLYPVALLPVSFLSSNPYL